MTGLLPHLHKALFVLVWNTCTLLAQNSLTFFSCHRALHWVTPQMLCVPVNEEIPEVSDMVVKAITGLWMMMCTFTALNFISLAYRDYFLLSSEVQAVRFAVCGIGLVLSPVKGEWFFCPRSAWSIRNTWTEQREGWINRYFYGRASATDKNDMMLAWPSKCPTHSGVWLISF